MKTPSRQTLSRWRLVLGRAAEPHHIGLAADEAELRQVAQVLDYLFDGADQAADSTGTSPATTRRGGAGPGHPMTVPHWVQSVRQLFPRQAREVLEKELIKRKGIAGLLQQPELLEQVEPNLELVKTLLTHKDLLKPETRAIARKIIDSVVRELKDKLKVQVEQSISGALRKDRHAPRKVFRNLDLKTTLRRNLQNWDEERRLLVVDRTYFFAAERRKRPWHVVVAVDQSGSMLESAVFSAVMASIFHELPAVRTSFFLFDTDIADLSGQVGQPVDILMSVQLGGGTDIAQAMRYAQQLVREPAKTIMVLISDFYEGGSEAGLLQRSAEMAESGVRVIGLGALSYDARPDFNRSLANRLRKTGMDFLVCTPETLVQSIERIIRG